MAKDPLDAKFEAQYAKQKAEEAAKKDTVLKKFVAFVNKTEGRDKFGKIIQFWARAASYFTRNVSRLHAWGENVLTVALNVWQTDGTHSNTSETLDLLWRALLGAFTLLCHAYVPVSRK